MEQQKTKGQGFLKVTGILMIIFGAIGLIFSILALVGSAFVGSALNEVDESQLGTFLIIASVIAIIDSAIEFIAGILGVKNCKNTGAWKTCLIWGIFVLVLAIIGLIFTFVGGQDSAVTIIVSIICSIAIPVLFIIGAVLNKKEEEAA